MGSEMWTAALCTTFGAIGISIATAGVLSLIIEVYMTKSARDIDYFQQLIRAIALLLLLAYFYHHKSDVMFYFTLLHEIASWYLLGLKFRYEVVIPQRRRGMAMMDAGDF